MAVASRRRAPAEVSDPEQWPAVTVLVAAYAEAQTIGPKVRDVLANGYPGPLDVMVVRKLGLPGQEELAMGAA